MNKFRVKRGINTRMASIKYSQIENVELILNAWWTVPGLPIGLQKSLLGIKKAVAANKEVKDELRQKIIADYAQKDENGNPVTVNRPVLNERGEPAKDADGNAVTVPAVVFVDTAAADAQWDELMRSSFDCPAIEESALVPYVEKLSITPQVLEVIESIIAE